MSEIRSPSATSADIRATHYRTIASWAWLAPARPDASPRLNARACPAVLSTLTTALHLLPRTCPSAEHPPACPAPSRMRQ